VTTAVGIDVGGTKIAAGLVDVTTGRLLRRLEVPTAPDRGPRAVLADCLRLGSEVKEHRDVDAVGLGICETVDAAGQVTSADTVDWRDVDLPAALGALGAVHVESDVRAAALAEARLGAGAGLREVLHVVVGTGIAACLVLDGVPYAGARGNAIVVGAPPVEELASGKALAARHGVARAQDVLADPRAEPLVAGAAAALGAALAALVNALDPAVVVMGGGLGLVDTYRARVVEAMRRLVWAPTTAAVPVRPAALGPDAGIVGAALAAADRTAARRL
jgi:glucokinase